MLMGPSQIGKSELALSLIRRNHRLIADDCVTFTKTADSILLGTCPPLLQDFLAIRNLGIINVRKMFGSDAICEQKPVQLIIKLITPAQQHDIAKDHLQSTHHMQSLIDIAIPAWTLIATPGRDLVTLIETTVYQQQLLHSGYNASIDIETKQQQLLNLNKEYL